MRDAVQYIRVSSTEQAKDGHSLPAQEREGRAYAEKNGMEILVFFRDVETAKSSGREDFGKLLAYLKKQKKPVALIAEKTDRLYRNYEDMVEIKSLVKRCGHEVHLYREHETLTAQTPSKKWLMHYFNVALATNYVENLSEEIIKGRTEKLRSGGWPHKAPVGYRNDKNLRETVVDEETAPYIREAFALFASGLYSLERLSEKLFESGLIYRPEMPKMSKTSLAKALKNPFYIGEMRIKGELFQGKHEPLIEKETWLQAQEAFRKDGKPFQYGTHDFKYSRLFTCHECGSVMTAEEKKGGRYVYYRCAARKKGCSQGYISEEKINKALDTMIYSLEIPDEIKQDILLAAEELESDDTPGEELRKIHAEISRYRTFMKHALQEKIEGTIEPDLYAELMADYQNSIRMLESKIEKLVREDVSFFKIASDLVDIPRTLSQRWPRANFDQKLRILNFVAANFSIEGQNVRYKLKEPFSLLGKKALCTAWWRMRDDARTIFSLHSEAITIIKKALAA